jgi:hypothetical protein
MTFSKADLLANETLALQLFGQHCVNAAIGEPHKKDSPQFDRILSTTWEALADHGYVHYTTMWYFRLTPCGWIKAQDATRTLCNPQMNVDLGLILKSLKDCLKGRTEAVSVGIDKIVNETCLPHYWVVNVISSHLIEHCLHQKGADWAPDDDNESMIRVPVNCGHSL